jgi:dynein heavy chain 1
MGETVEEKVVLYLRLVNGSTRLNLYIINLQEAFANEVNKSAKQWPIEISRQTKLVESSFPGSAEKEVAFWKDLDRKLADTKSQLESLPILLTKLVLKRTNRISEQLIREAEIELDRSTELVQVSVTFLRDFPIQDILGATSLHPNLSRAVGACLQHFSKLRHSK